MCFRPATTAMPKKCPACQTLCKPDLKTCPACGADIPDAPPTPGSARNVSKPPGASKPPGES